MPLTEKGEDIKRAMEKNYGKEKGERVFYASKNKGVISGIDDAEPADYLLTRFDGVVARLHDCAHRLDALAKRCDDRSSAEHSEEASRLEALAEKETDPDVKRKLLARATFHREEVGLDSSEKMERAKTELMAQTQGNNETKRELLDEISRAR